MASNRTGDFHELPERDREAGHSLIEVYRNADFCQRVGSDLFQVLVAGETEACGESAQEDVLCDGHLRNQTEFLVDQGDPSVDRSSSAWGYRRSENLDRSAIGFDDPGHDAHERRFPGAVLANDRMNLTGRDPQGYVVHGQGTAESLGDAAGGDSDIGRTRGGHTRLQSVHEEKQLAGRYVSHTSQSTRIAETFPKRYLLHNSAVTTCGGAPRTSVNYPIRQTESCPASPHRGRTRSR